MRPAAPTDRATAEALRLLADVRERVDRVLGDELARARGEVAAADPEASLLVEEIERLVLAGGKRLRPTLCVLGHRAAGGLEDDRLLRVAAGLELLHTFALIHDDVMDEAAVRRGVPSVHAHLSALHRDLGRPGDHERFGRSAAILAGDLAAVLAEDLFMASGFPPDVLLPAARRFGRMRVEMAAGQLLDVASTGGEALDESRARRIAALKTGSYTVEGPLHVGAILAGASIEVLSALSRYGAPLGEAFQVRDDILGALGEGERADEGDLVQGKPTVVLSAARRLLGAREAARLAADGVEEARERLRTSGAFAAARALLDRLVEESVDALGGENLEPGAVEALRGLAGLFSLPPEGPVP